MKLYYLPGACSLADHIVLEWTGAPYEAHAVPRDQLKTEYLKINPLGVVPALVEDDGWVLTENVAILGYLAEKYPQAELAGTDMRSRADVMRWLGFLNSDIHPAFKPIFGPARFIADESQHAELIDNARARLRDMFGRVNEQLKGGDWITGKRSIADPYLFVVLRWAKGKGVDLSGFDELERFSARMREDEGVKAAMKAEGL
ncbi:MULTISPECIES: glutathione S-transferase N-terminal domain-containing protein [Dyella]|uniref:Glutathione S-transferase family protein n=2 Tax=Dyella TaxID=231454 RepID=A0A4R0YTJ5_9GAMM|nr:MULTISPECIES: glutathione S-transferase N-terminal domain-containing protein [Dyella]TBR39868.1 glutathione S-transferase family protein [Dyella terrae]TCI12552.1 glutathione S-transferase family protein [Dyella soli]